ncbi:hypothetical protein [Streptomyces sp. AMCC400023]|uniref:hypothetical protein n=1 Tax=Streptomyces sp. AMCC400023 TaxID=2056258 RepID=UPI001F18A74F|nr:hypothetical protein [Streptomyces sp. AMCC400023]UJV43827.1 hypothetical protein CVT30_31925 [Streptomyces sp. AMCC400023]
MADLTPQITDEQRDTIARQAAELHSAIAQLAESFIPVARAIVEAFNQLGRQLREAGLIDDDGKLIKAADRPAWQSPYGPPQSRR